MLNRHTLTISDFQILIKSCSIESGNDPSPKSKVVHETKFSLKISYSTNACLAQLDQHQTCKPVMVSVVSSNPTGGNFISQDTLMLILYKNGRFVLFTSTSIELKDTSRRTITREVDINLIVLFLIQYPPYISVRLREYIESTELVYVGFGRETKDLSFLIQYSVA